jgi:hypothetical protein
MVESPYDGMYWSVKLPDGTERWYKNGQLHRDNGPAVEYYGVTKYWYKEYWLEGKKYTKEQYNEKINNTAMQSKEK